MWRALLAAGWRPSGDDYQPSNITFSLLAPWEGGRLKKRAKHQAMAERALVDLQEWMKSRGLP